MHVLGTFLATKIDASSRLVSPRALGFILYQFRYSCWLPFSSFVSLWAPFGSILASFAPLWHPLVLLWLPFGILWLPRGGLLAPIRPLWAPFGLLLSIFVTILHHFGDICVEFVSPLEKYEADYTNFRTKSFYKVEGSNFGSAESRSVNNSPRYIDGVVLIVNVFVLGAARYARSN